MKKVWNECQNEVLKMKLLKLKHFMAARNAFKYNSSWNREVWKNVNFSLTILTQMSTCDIEVNNKIIEYTYIYLLNQHVWCIYCIYKKALANTIHKVLVYRLMLPINRLVQCNYVIFLWWTFIVMDLCIAHIALHYYYICI